LQGFLYSHTLLNGCADCAACDSSGFKASGPLEGGRFATSDLNDLYRRVINRNNR
jgi:hypothetical protein